MEWNSKLKKIGNIFNAISNVGMEIGNLGAKLTEAVKQLTRVADNVSSIDTALGQLGTKIMGHGGSGLGDVLETSEQIEGLTDQFGNQKSPPYNVIDVLAFICLNMKTSHEKVDALVDRLGNQFTNEVLSVLKQENAELEAAKRELDRCNRELVEKAEGLERDILELKEKEDGDSEGDQVEPVPGS